MLRIIVPPVVIGGGHMGHVGPPPSLAQLAAAVAVCMAFIWVVLIVWQWLVYLAEGNRTNTLIGVVRLHARFIGYALRHLW